MKVKISTTVDINAEAWTLNYGTAPNEIRADVKAYVDDLIRQHLTELGLLAEEAS